MGEFLKIWLLCIVAAILYGIIHDQFTARICLEYFTIYHPPVFPTADPTLLALGWGVIATWWMGAIIGLPLALLARVGTWPKLTAGDLRKPLMVLLISMAVCALVAGMIGYLHALHQHRTDFDCRLLADHAAHSSSYAVGELGGMLLCGVVLLNRWKRKKNAQMGPNDG